MKIFKSPQCIRYSAAMVVAGAPLLMSQSMVAGVLMTESFDYAEGNLAGNNGGTGWNAAWTETDPDGTATVTATGLTFSDMPVSGGAAKLQITNNSGFVDQKASRAAGVSATVGDDLWVSFLYTQPDAPLASTSSRTAELRAGTRMRIAAKNSGSQGVGLRYDSSGATSANGTKNVQDGNTYLIVARFGDVGQATGKSALMWVLDVADYDAIKDGGVTQAELDANNFLSLSNPHANQNLLIGNAVDLAIADSSGTSFSAIYDELRYGTEVGDVVTVVPEPGSFALAGIGALAMLMRRKD